jgi:predicted methyltransferase
VLDHSAQAGSGLRDTDTLHRIDQATLRAEVEAAGFVFVSENNGLRNPADPRTANVFDPGIRGHTDQFILKFRKPR